MRYASRNNALEFASRTRKNLLFIEKARETDPDVYPVTQLANSLLGLIVLPLEKHFVEHIKRLELQKLVNDGWPQFEISLGKCDTLGDLIKRLRNAVAHGHMSFSSDSHLADQVVIEVEDYRGTPKEAFWRAQLRAKDLRMFCLRFTDLLEQTIG